MNEIDIVGDGAGLVTSVRPEIKANIPDTIQLYQNYPNPFNPSTTITFYLPRTELVNISVYNIAGQAIETLVDGEVPAGQHQLRWSASALASGMYVYRLQAGGFVEAKKLIYQK